MSEEAKKEPSDRKSPGFWFYPSDYIRDMQLLPLAAQGLWMRLLCEMGMNEMHRGFLELPNGDPMTDADIATLVGKDGRGVRAALVSLERIGTFSRDDRGCIFCRRMAREETISNARRTAAEKRWKSAQLATTRPPLATAKPRRHLDRIKTESIQDTSTESTKDDTFAYPKVDAKPMQNPSVSASASVSVLLKTPSNLNGHASTRFEDWWRIWSSVRGSNHYLNAEQIYPRIVSVEMETNCFACTESYLHSLTDPAKGYNPENFLIDQSRDGFQARFPARAGPQSEQRGSLVDRTKALIQRRIAEGRDPI